jgi:hypothetical protein
MKPLHDWIATADADAKDARYLEALEADVQEKDKEHKGQEENKNA